MAEWMLRLYDAIAKCSQKFQLHGLGGFLYNISRDWLGVSGEVTMHRKMLRLSRLLSFASNVRPHGELAFPQRGFGCVNHRVNMATKKTDHAYERAFPGQKLPLLSHGHDFADACGAYVKEKGFQDAFILAAPALFEKTPALQHLQDTLGSRIKGSFIGIGPHTPVVDVLEAARQLREVGRVDCLITLGGGSVTDGGKLMRFFIANGASSEDHVDTLWGNKVVNQKRPTDVKTPEIPLIHIPTTLSGGEFQHIAGGTFSATGIKQLFEPGMEADVIIQDPKLCTTTPSNLWIGSGVRSLDHCIEALCSLHRTEAGNQAAKKGLEILIPGLLTCKHEPENVEARSLCQQGLVHAVSAMCSGVPLGASHAIGHQLGPLGVGHGETSCVLLPAVCKFNYANNANVDQQNECVEILLKDKKVRELLQAKNVSNPDLGDILDVIIRELGMPRTLSEVSVGREQFEKLAENSLQDPWAKTNPVSLTTKVQVMEILSMVA